MIAILLQQVAERAEISLWGVLIPALIFIVAFTMTMLLYRHFASQQAPSSEAEPDDEGKED